MILMSLRGRRQPRTGSQQCVARLHLAIAWLLLFAVFAADVSAAEARLDFSSYILRAVEQTSVEHAGKGYKSESSFAADLPFGKAGVLKARHAPYSMCVGAILQIIVTALNIYADQMRDQSPFTFLPKATWERLRPIDLRGQIWIVRDAPSSGTADALASFGMGVPRDFGALPSGGFINLNRANGTGHAVVFISYLDGNGNTLADYSSDVAGFKYFSSQGTEINGGFGYRYAFFGDTCPDLPANKKRDCGVIRSSSRRLLNSGIMLHPTSWDRNKARAQLLTEDFHAKRGETDMLRDGSFDAAYFSGLTTDD